MEEESLFHTNCFFLGFTSCSVQSWIVLRVMCLLVDCKLKQEWNEWNYGMLMMMRMVTIGVEYSLSLSPSFQFLPPSISLFLPICPSNYLIYLYICICICRCQWTKHIPLFEGFVICLLQRYGMFVLCCVVCVQYSDVSSTDC